MARVLVIDDDQTMRQLIVAALEKAGHEMVEAGSGREGAMLFQHRPVDMIITDLIMPDDSLDLVLALRAANPTLPFILISGIVKDSPRLVDAATALGVTQTLPKPFQLGALVAATEAVLTRRPAPPQN